MSTRVRFWTVSSGCTSWHASRALQNRQVSPDSLSGSAPQSSPRHLYAEPRRPREALHIRPGRCRQSNRQASSSSECSPRGQQPFPSRQPGGVHLDHGNGQTREPILPRALVSQEVFDSAQELRLNDRVATFSSTTFPRRPTLVLPPLFQSSLHISSDGLVKVRRQPFKLLRRHFHAVKPTAPPPCENTWCAE